MGVRRNLWLLAGFTLQTLHDGLCGVALSLQPLPSCGFAGAQPRLTQNAAPLAFCRLCRRSLSVQWPASPCFPSLPQARTCAKAHSKIGEFAKANSRNATMWHDPIPHARKLAGGHQTYLWDFISLHWVNHNDQFFQPDCELSEEFKSDCLVWMLFNGKNLTAGADNLLWDNREWSITNHFIPYSLVFRQFRYCTFIVSLQNFMAMKSVCFAVVEYKFIFATFFCFVQSYIGF